MGTQKGLQIRFKFKTGALGQISAQDEGGEARRMDEKEGLGNCIRREVQFFFFFFF